MYKLQCKKCGNPMNAFEMSTPPKPGNFLNNIVQCNHCGQSAIYGVEAKWVQA